MSARPFDNPRDRESKERSYSLPFPSPAPLLWINHILMMVKHTIDRILANGAAIVIYSKDRNKYHQFIGRQFLLSSCVTGLIIFFSIGNRSFPINKSSRDSTDRLCRSKLRQNECVYILVTRVIAQIAYLKLARNSYQPPLRRHLRRLYTHYLPSVPLPSLAGHGCLAKFSTHAFSIS